MIAYKEIAQIKHVCALEPVTGKYAYQENGYYCLALDGLLLKDKSPIISIDTEGEYTYVNYNNSRIEVYSGHTLLKTFDDPNVLLCTTRHYIGRYHPDRAVHEGGLNNIQHPLEDKELLAKSAPYFLGEVDGIIFGFEPNDDEFCRLDYSGDVVWSFTYQTRSDWNDSCIAQPEFINIIGIAQGLLWLNYRGGQLVALDLETGELRHLFSPGHIEKDHSPHTIIEGLGYGYFRPSDQTIVSISRWGIHIIDASTAERLESYAFSEVDPHGIGAFEDFEDSRFGEDCFTFIGKRTRESSGMRWAGVFDLKTRKLLWADEVIPRDEEETSCRYVAHAGDKLYIKDSQDTLHIYQRE